MSIMSLTSVAVANHSLVITMKRGQPRARSPRGHRRRYAIRKPKKASATILLAQRQLTPKCARAAAARRAHDARQPAREDGRRHSRERTTKNLKTDSSRLEYTCRFSAKKAASAATPHSTHNGRQCRAIVSTYTTHLNDDNGRHDAYAVEK